MRKVIVVCLLAFLAGCTNKTSMIQRDADRIANDVIRFRLDSLEPLDLSKYKEVNYTIVEDNGVRYVYLTVQEYQKVEELLMILGGRIDVLTQQVQKYEKGFDNANSGSTVPDVGVDGTKEVSSGKR